VDVLLPKPVSVPILLAEIKGLLARATPDTALAQDSQEALAFHGQMARIIAWIYPINFDRNPFFFSAPLTPNLARICSTSASASGFRSLFMRIIS
jgi:hypothetical protein